MSEKLSIIFGVIYLISLAVVFLVLVRMYLLLPKKGKKHKEKRFFPWKSKKSFDVSDYETFIYQLTYALKWMSDSRVGALIVVEREKSLDSYISLGYQISAKLTSEFLITIFSNKYSSLHDGGVIVRGFNIVSISSYFPVTQTKLTTALGARHRASAGLTENSDAIAFIVSETNGKVSYSVRGEIKQIFSGDINSMTGQIFELLNFYMD